MRPGLLAPEEPGDEHHQAGAEDQPSSGETTMKMRDLERAAG